MVAFLFQQQKALCHFSLLVTPISLRIFSILLQKCRQYCLLCIQCKKGWHNAQIERSYSNAAIYADLYDSASFEAKKMIVSQLIRRVDVYRGYQIHVDFNFDLAQYLENSDELAC